VAAAGADFHLQADSPAIDRGSPLGGPAVDFDDNARPQDGNGDGTAAYDPGAYEVPAAYYVAPDGDDTQPGSFSQPWRTIQKAANTVQAGDTVKVRGGVYNETVTIPVSGSAGRGYITFQNYLEETPTLDGTGLAVPDRDTGMFLIVDQSYLIIKGFEIRNYQSAIVDRVPVGINVQGAGHHIEIRDNHIHHIETTAPPQGPDRLGADAHGILVLGTAAPDSIHDIIIDGNELDHLKLGSSEALVLNGNVELFTVTHNIVHDNDNIGIDLIGFEGTSTGAYDRARNGVIINNTVYNIDSRTNPAYGGERAAGGIYVDGGTAITIARNRVYASNIGIELASEHRAGTTSDVTVRNNFVFNNHAAGISLGGYDAERGGTEHCAIVNNSLYSNDTGQQGNGEIAVNYRARDNVIKNNIVYANSQNLLIGSEYSLTNNEVDYNLYFAPAGTEHSQWQWAGTRFEGFAAYRAQTGNDAHSAFVDPRFVDLVAPDLHLRPTSPAIDAGQSLAEAGNDDIDAEARRQGNAIDLGADETSFLD
jgi:hypothetical protein